MLLILLLLLLLFLFLFCLSLPAYSHIYLCVCVKSFPLMSVNLIIFNDFLWFSFLSLLHYPRMYYFCVVLFLSLVQVPLCFVLSTFFFAPSNSHSFSDLFCHDMRCGCDVSSVRASVAFYGILWDRGGLLCEWVLECSWISCLAHTVGWRAFGDFMMI